MSIRVGIYYINCHYILFFYCLYLYNVWLYIILIALFILFISSVSNNKHSSGSNQISNYKEEQLFIASAQIFSNGLEFIYKLPTIYII